MQTNAEFRATDVLTENKKLVERFYEEARIGKGRYRKAVSATELPPESAAGVFKDVLSPFLTSRMMRSFLQMGYDLNLNSTEKDFMKEAYRHPVFEANSKA